MDVNLLNLKISDMVNLKKLDVTRISVERPQGDFLKSYEPDLRRLEQVLKPDMRKHDERLCS